MINLGERIKYYRKKKGYTQNRLSIRVFNRTGREIDRTRLSHLESNRGNPTLQTISDICEGLEITLAEFFNEER